MKSPKNANYCATVTTIKHLIPLENCDNVVHSNFFGDLVIVSKDSKIGDKGILFPVETQLSKQFLSNNNLYRDPLLNVDKTKKGYFEENGRIRAVKFRGHKSQGLFMPMSSIAFAYDKDIKEGEVFDELNGIEICRKYIPKFQNTPGSGKKKKERKSFWSGKKPKSILIDGQFRFHPDTMQLGKNLHRINADTLISISRKMHGCNFVVSNVLTKKKLTIWNKIGKTLKFDVKDTEYGNLYSSRTVLKNANPDKNNNHYYGVDIWGLANEKLKDFLAPGMTIYGEIVGYLPSGAMIQKGFDYSCKEKEFDTYIFRITYTTPSGHVIEMAATQVQEWCKNNGLKAVQQYYYGDAWRLSHKTKEEFNQSEFLEYLKSTYLEKECWDCFHKVPDEGIVLRIEGLEFDAVKLKSWNFLQFETKQLDSGEQDIETQESEEKTEEIT